LNVFASNTFELFTTKEVAAVIIPTDSIPIFTLVEVAVRKIMLLAVTAVVEIVAVPLDNVPVPTDALLPVAILNLLPAVPKLKLPPTLTSWFRAIVPVKVTAPDVVMG
jgi:hypothetical protein